MERRIMSEEIDTATAQFDNLRNQIESTKKVAKALDENPAAVSNAITHLMLGGLLQGLQVVEMKINQLSVQISKEHNGPRIYTP